MGIVSSGHSRALVLRYAWIHFVGPGKDAAGQVLYFGKAGLAKQSDRLGAAESAAAVGHDFAARIQLVQARGQIAQRDEMSAKVADLIFVRLAGVEDEQVVARVEPGLQFLGANFRHGGSRRSFLSLAAYAAELLVVDQFADGGIGAADWALRVLAQAQFAKAHS